MKKNSETLSKVFCVLQPRTRLIFFQSRIYLSTTIVIFSPKTFKMDSQIVIFQSGQDILHGIILCFSNRNRINILTDLPLYLTYTYILKNQSHNLLKLHENMYVIATTNGHGKCNSLILCLINVIIHRHLIFLTLQYKFHELFSKRFVEVHFLITIYLST